MIAALLLALVGTFAVTGIAAAAPTTYPPPVSAVVAVNTNSVNIVDGQGTVTFSGSGFRAGESIDIVVSYTSPDGVRSNKLLKTVVADAFGNFSTLLTLTQAGTATLTATGETSGQTAALTVVVVAAGATTPVQTTTTVVATTVVSTTTDSGLAYTGADIGGPLAVGASALIAGLALLFFGTRLAVRRRHGPSAH